MLDFNNPAGWKKLLLAAGAVAILGILGGILYGCHREHKATQPQVMEYHDTTDPVKAADQLKLSDDSAKSVTKEIYRIQQTQPTPTVTYYVQAPDLTSGAEKVAQDIKTEQPSVPAAAKEKTDRTMVTADQEHQKVDVYKVNLRKPHKIKAGVMYTGDRTYYGVGYQQGRWEGMIYTKDGRRIQAGSVTYTVAEW